MASSQGSSWFSIPSTAHFGASAEASSDPDGQVATAAPAGASPAPPLNGTGAGSVDDVLSVTAAALLPTAASGLAAASSPSTSVGVPVEARDRPADRVLMSAGTAARAQR